MFSDDQQQDVSSGLKNDKKFKFGITSMGEGRSQRDCKDYPQNLKGKFEVLKTRRRWTNARKYGSADKRMVDVLFIKRGITENVLLEISRVVKDI